MSLVYLEMMKILRCQCKHFMNIMRNSLADITARQAQTVKESVSHRRIPGEKCERGAMRPHFRARLSARRRQNGQDGPFCEAWHKRPSEGKDFFDKLTACRTTVRQAVVEGLQQEDYRISGIVRVTFLIHFRECTRLKVNTAFSSSSQFITMYTYKTLYPRPSPR